MAAKTTPTCAVCGKDVGDDAVRTQGGWRHESCSPFGVAAVGAEDEVHLISPVAPEEDEEPAEPEPTRPASSSPLRTPTVRFIPLERLRESPTNARRTWGDMKELTASVAKLGVLQPVLARPMPDGGDDLELVFGHRRFRAAKAAKLEAVPVMVRAMTDLEALEAQVVENVARQDVHPLEEAEGYELLHDKHGLDVETIAAKVGKSKGYVYGRMKLLALCPAARKAFYEGKLLPSVALYVARVPTRLQPELLEDLENETYDGDPVSARDAFRIIEHRYMLRLADAPFDRNDKTLVPEAGSCKDCPKRTGKQKELFADVKSADTCTDPDCFNAKKEAHGERLVAEATAKGRTILEGKAAQDATSWGSEYVALEDRISPPYDPKAEDDQDDEDLPTYRELAKDAEIEIVVAKDARGELKELVRKVDIEPVVKKAGFKDDNLRQHTGGVPARADDEKKRREAAARKRVATLAVMAAVVAAAERKVPGSNVWSFLAKLLIDLVGHDAGLEILKRRGVDTKRASGVHHDAVESKLRKLLDGMKDDQVRGFAIELAASRGTYQFGPYSNGDLSTSLRAAAAFYGVDPKKVGGAARSELAAKKKAKKPAKRGRKS